MDALRVDDPVLGREPHCWLSSSTNGPAALTIARAEVVNCSPLSTSRSSRHPAVADAVGADQFDVVGGCGAGLDRRAHEREHEPGVVVDEVGVLVLDPADGGWWCRSPVPRALIRSASNSRGGRVPNNPDRPVGGGAEAGEPRSRTATMWSSVARKRDLLDVVGVGLHQPVARAAEPEHERELVVLEVLEAAPHEVRRLLAGEAAEVAAVDQRHRRATARRAMPPRRRR